MPDFNSMSTEQIVTHYRGRGGQNALDTPSRPVEYEPDYQRRAGEIDNDTRRTPEQKAKAKQLLSRAALSRIGK